MQLNEAIDRLTDWVQTNICDGMELLKPSEDGMSTDFDMVTPTAFPLYIPPKDLLPPDVSQQAPAVCIQLKEGSDDLKESGRSLKLRLAFSTYRPGHFMEDKDGNVVFVKDADGWKDLWIWVSRSLNKIQSEMYIEGVKVDRTVPMKYGHFQIDDTLVDAYPLWYAWIDFTVVCGLSFKNNSNYMDNL